MLTPDEQLELLSLSNDEFADGLARMVKLFTNAREKKDEVTLFAPTSSVDTGNYLLLEDNTPIVGG